MDKVEILNKNGDIIQWLRKLTELPGHKFEAAIALAKTKTCKALKISFDRMELLTYQDKLEYSDEETKILNRYYDELRKIKNSKMYSDIVR